jgi:PPM family protein phosphatase
MVRVNDREIEELKKKAEVFCGLIDESLHAEIRENPKLTGMGTTLTLCYSAGPNLFTIHVGDSRAYRYRDGTLRQLTRDHNLGQMLIDTGAAEPDSPSVLRMRHVLTNCLGGPGSGVTVDVDHYTLADNDRVMLCTDGLNDMVGDEEIARALDQHASSPDACAALVDLALKRGGKDNVTVVVARYRVESQP